MSGVSILVAFERIRQPARYGDLKIRPEQRGSEVTTNELKRAMVDIGMKNPDDNAFWGDRYFSTKAVEISSLPSSAW